MAVAAVDALAADVMCVAELNGLLHEHAWFVLSGQVHTGDDAAQRAAMPTTARMLSRE